MSLRALIEKRTALIADIRVIADAAGDNEITGDQRDTYDRLIAEQETLGTRITEEQRLVEAERDAAQAAVRHLNGGAGDPGGAGAPSGEHRTTDPLAAERATRLAEFRTFMRSNEAGRYEFRALSADSAPDGGYLVGPEQFVADLIKSVDDLVFLRQMATVQTVTQARSLGVPTLDTNPADADWTSELATGSEDSTIAFGKRVLWPRPLAKRIKLSKDLLMFNALPAEDIVKDRLAYKFAITQEKGFLTGTGANQPLGVFTAATDGISTSRDVSTGNSTTAMTFDGLIEAKYSLKGQYWPRATWIFHRAALKALMKLKDGEGDYLWQPAVVAGQPDRLLNMPLKMSEYAPSTFTTGLYVGILGDFSNYWIADAMDLQLQRLVELYAETNQIGYIGRLMTDGMPVLEEAFARVKLA